MLMFHSNAAFMLLFIHILLLVGCLQGIYADTTVNGLIKGLYDSPVKHRKNNTVKELILFIHGKGKHRTAMYLHMYA